MSVRVGVKGERKTEHGIGAAFWLALAFVVNDVHRRGVFLQAAASALPAPRAQSWINLNAAVGFYPDKGNHRGIQWAKPQPKRSATGPRSQQLRMKRDAWLNPTSHCERGRCGRGTARAPPLPQILRSLRTTWTIAVQRDTDASGKMRPPSGASPIFSQFPLVCVHRCPSVVSIPLFRINQLKTWVRFVQRTGTSPLNWGSGGHLFPHCLPFVCKWLLCSALVARVDQTGKPFITLEQPKTPGCPVSAAPIPIPPG